MSVKLGSYDDIFADRSLQQLPHVHDMVVEVRRHGRKSTLTCEGHQTLIEFSSHFCRLLGLAEIASEPFVRNAQTEQLQVARNHRQEIIGQIRGRYLRSTAPVRRVAVLPVAPLRVSSSQLTSRMIAIDPSGRPSPLR